MMAPGVCWVNLQDKLLVRHQWPCRSHWFAYRIILNCDLPPDFIVFLHWHPIFNITTPTSYNIPASSQTSPLIRTSLKLPSLRKTHFSFTTNVSTTRRQHDFRDHKSPPRYRSLRWTTEVVGEGERGLTHSMVLWNLGCHSCFAFFASGNKYLRNVSCHQPCSWLWASVPNVLWSALTNSFI